ncbi:MAG: hypothetical protein M1533_00345, partial [Candidatus Thermoplasmatota archaeon]|nr:hypothetical protein [Candidatus Thermoplasmatota archaeon]MCL5794068.1 hypothetical protein [Candidatus Thermoplasmatota archaeon]
TSPSVDLHALQDYWYSSPPSNGLPSGTPISDNSYPNMYSVGYSSSAAVILSAHISPVSHIISVSQMSQTVSRTYTTVLRL